MPDEGYSDASRDFVKACLHKIPKMRPTYAMLLQHPWLLQLSKPETITEEDEDEEGVEEVADAVGKMKLDSTTDDAEVAEWVNRVLRGETKGLPDGETSRPALHAAPLDSVSPMSSP